MATAHQDLLLGRLLELVQTASEGTPGNEARARQLAMQWPSLASALSNLLEAYGMKIPRPLRLAAIALQQEQMAVLPGDHND